MNKNMVEIKEKMIIDEEEYFNLLSYKFKYCELKEQSENIYKLMELILSGKKRNKTL